MSGERISIGSRSGKGESFFNLGDVFQLGRRSGAGRAKNPGGYGFYGGKPELSYGMSISGEEEERKKKKHRLMNKLNQQSIYGESRKNYSLEGKGWSDSTKFKYIIYVVGGRKLADSEYPRDIYRYQSLIKSISNEKSNSYLFIGGTVFERGNDIYISSALFDKSDIQNAKNRVMNFANRLAAHGIQVKVQLVKAR